MPRRREINPEDRSATCPVCGGLGFVVDEETGERSECPRCRGRGRITVTGLVDVEPF